MSSALKSVVLASSFIGFAGDATNRLVEGSAETPRVETEKSLNEMVRNEKETKNKSDSHGLSAVEQRILMILTFLLMFVVHIAGFVVVFVGLWTTVKWIRSLGVNKCQVEPEQTVKTA